LGIKIQGWGGGCSGKKEVGRWYTAAAQKILGKSRVASFTKRESNGKGEEGKKGKLFLVDAERNQVET